MEKAQLMRLRVRRAISVGTAVALLLATSLLAASPAAAAAIVNPAGSGGFTSISADTASDAPGAAWTTLTGPSLTEQAAGDIGNGTIILNAPSGFAFDTSGASVAKSSFGVCGLTVSVAAQAAGSITTTISGGPSTNGNTCTLTWSSIRVQPLAKAANPLPSGSIVASGTAVVAGVTGTTSFGTLREVGGTATKLTLSGPAGCKAGVACTTQPTALVQDAWGNTASSSAAITLALTTKPTGATMSVTTNPVNASNGVAQFAGFSVSTFGSYVLTATSTGLTSATSSFTAGYGTCGGAVTQKCVTSFKVDLTGSGTFASVTDANTTLDVSETSGSVQVQVKYTATGSDGYDLYYAGSPYSANTVFEIGLNVGSYEVIETVLTGSMLSYTLTIDPVGGNTVTLRGTPRASSWKFSGCTVVSCGDLTTVASVDYGGLLIGAVSDMTFPGTPPPSFATFRSASRGAWIATNAQSFTPPNVDPVTGAFIFQVAAPHLKKAGGTNTGFFSAFVPDTLLSQYWGIANPASLPVGSFTTTQTVSGVTTTVTTTVTRSTSPGGFVINAPSISYSTPNFSIAPAPSVSSVSPASGSISGGTTVQITGTALTAASAVLFGDTPATAFTVVSSTLIRATAPSRAAGAAVDVLVTTAGGTSAAGQRFQYTEPSQPDPEPAARAPAPPPPPPVTTLPTTPSTQPISTTLPVQLGTDGVVTAPTTIAGGTASMALPAGTTVRSGGVAFSGQLKPPSAVTATGVESAYDFSPGTALTFDRPITLTLPVPSGSSASDFQPVTIDARGMRTYLSASSVGTSTVTLTTDHLTVFGLARVPRPTVREVARAVATQTGYHAAWSGQSDYVDLSAGQLVDLAVRFKNTGTSGWYRGNQGTQADLGSNDPLDNRRDFDAGILVSPLFGTNRYATTDVLYVGPGDVGTFSMRLRAPGAPGAYQVRVRPVIEGVTWMEDEGVFLQIVVK